MKNLSNNYLINKLKNGEKLNIALLSHNAYWPAIQKLDSHFENCNVFVFGNSTSYIKLASEQRCNQIENCDLIIYYSSQNYNEKEFIELKNMVSTISSAKNKRVSIGYSYIIPIEQREQQQFSEKIQIVSFDNDEEITDEIYPTSAFTVYDLVEFTLFVIDNYNSTKTHRLKKCKQTSCL